MLTLKKTAMTAALLAAFGFAGLAQALVIDLFDTGTGRATDFTEKNGAVPLLESGLSNVIGGARELSSNMTGGQFTGRSISTYVLAGSLFSTRDTGVAGETKVRWDGSANDSLDKNVLDLNLVLGSENWFELLLSADTTGGPILLTIWDTLAVGGDGSTKSITSTGAGLYKMSFADFSPLIDFGHIAAIELTMDTTAARFLAFNSLITNGIPGTPGTPGIPEPATLALLGLGLAGLGWSKRRRAA